MRPLGSAENKGRIGAANALEENSMTWSTPTLLEICVGLEINGYLPAEL